MLKVKESQYYSFALLGDIVETESCVVVYGFSFMVWLTRTGIEDLMHFPYEICWTMVCKVLAFAHSLRLADINSQ